MKLRQSFFVPSVPFVVAQECGLFVSEGLDVESIRTRSSGEQFDGLVSGELDLAITAMDNVFVWNHRGGDLRIVAQIESTTLLTVYGRPGTRTLADVANGRFAVDAAANGFSLVARWVLEKSGVSMSFVEVGGVKERLDALLGGVAEATLLGPPLDELAERSGMVALVSANMLLPNLAGQGVVARARRSDGQTEAVTAYLRVLALAITEADGLTDEEGTAILARAGFPGRSAVDAWRTRPRSIAVDHNGTALLESLRAGFGLLPDGYHGISSIVDDSLSSRIYA